MELEVSTLIMIVSAYIGLRALTTRNIAFLRAITILSLIALFYLYVKLNELGIMTMILS